MSGSSRYPPPAVPGSARAHQELLHQSVHLVPHHNRHAHQGIELLSWELVAVLICIHVVAISFWLYLLLHPAAEGKRRRRAANIVDLKCTADQPSDAARWRKLNAVLMSGWGCPLAAPCLYTFLQGLCLSVCTLEGGRVVVVSQLH